MKAETHVEVYRPYQGELSARGSRWIPLWRLGLRVALRRKLALVLLLAPSAIATVMFSFWVYSRFAIDSGLTPEALGGKHGIASVAGALFADRDATLRAVREMIALCFASTGMFSVLLMAWFGCGLVCDDRRSGAYLLLFARPMTRLDYVVGRFATVASFGALAGILPGVVICVIAAFASPEWSFVTREGWVVPRAIAFGALWTLYVSSLVLAASSIASRKAFALAALLGWFVALAPIGGLLHVATHEQAFSALVPLAAFARIGSDWFELGHGPSFASGYAWTAIGAQIVLAWTIVALRTRRVEVVA